MKKIFLLFLIVFLSACQVNSDKSDKSKSEASTTVAGYKNFTVFNDGYDLIYPESWIKSEKAKRESLHILGPKPQSASKIQPTINVSMNRGVIRFIDGASKHLKFEFEKYTTTYERGISERLDNYTVIEKEEKSINGLNSKSVKFSFNHEKSSEKMYEEVIFFQLPYRMYTMRLSCLFDEKFRFEDKYEIVKNSFKAKHSSVADF